jgi:hypothetical protein
MSPHHACLVCHHSDANFCQPVLLGSITGCLLKCVFELPIVALGPLLKLKVFSAIIHLNNVNLMPILLPCLTLFTCWINHSIFHFKKIHKLQLCLLINKDLAVLVVYIFLISLGFLMDFILRGIQVLLLPSFTSSVVMFIAFCFALPTVQAAHTPRVPWFDFQFRALQVCQHMSLFI